MKILLVEDDTFFQNFYSKKLSEKGLEVKIAHNGAEAMKELLAGFNPNIMLLDLIMPEKDGFEVLNEVSQHDSLKDIPILVFSTLGQDSDIEKALKLGATGYVNKTFFDFENLLSKVIETARK